MKGVYTDPTGAPNARFAAWHASLIRDPVARLRYLRTTLRPGHQEALRARRRRQGRSAICLASLFLLPAAPISEMHSPAVPFTAAQDGRTPAVWMVETNRGFEVYSNGLRIETRFAVAGRARHYRALARRSGGVETSALRSAPAGIVYHATESHMVPFEERRNRSLRMAGRQLLEYVRASRCYHFVIDRFGRVHRVVEEGDAANHAGWSVWADEDWVYLNLNDSFLAVAFEAQDTQDGSPALADAQIHAARVLTGMLRARYGIRAGNCVAHAQVSVNPRNQKIGYHADWAAFLPFVEMGLPDNYTQPLPSLFLFGFSCGRLLVETADAGMGRGIRAAEALLQREADTRGLAHGLYRAALRRTYRNSVEALGL